MQVCPGCRKTFPAGTGKRDHCCGHCIDNNRHGKSCQVTLTCHACQNEVKACEGKYIRSTGFLCGRCSSGRGHSLSCTFGVRQRRGPQQQTPTRLHRERSRSPRRTKSAHGELDTDRDGVELYECGICLEEFTFAVSLRECR